MQGKSAPILERPIFLMGSGRCGSTFFQRQFSRTGLIWIWGEHDGVIGRLLKWADDAASDKALKEFAFKMETSQIEAVFDLACDRDATSAAWVNGFRGHDLERFTRDMICGLMSCNLPAGKKRWGFKEIRYGPEDKTADRLLRLYPEARILHTLRHPFATIESNVLSWNRAEILAADGCVSQPALEKQYLFYATRWASVSRYFLHLEASMPQRVRSVHLESYIDEVEGIAQFIDCPPLPRSTTPINIRTWSMGDEGGRIHAAFHECRTKFSHVVADAASLAGYAV